MSLEPTPVEREAFRANKMKQVQAAIGKKANGKAAEQAPQLMPQRLKQAGQTFGSYDIVVPDPEWNHALTNTKYLGKISPQLRRGAKLEIVNDSFTKLAQARVVGIDVHARQVDLVILAQHELTPSRLGQGANPDDLYEIKDAGIELGWQLIRKADGQLMRSGLKDYEAALIERRHQHAVDLGRG
jgi:hypothetical protein